jgi:hypothetical protein
MKLHKIPGIAVITLVFVALAMWSAAVVWAQQDGQLWTKTVNGQPWTSGMEVTVETSDTIQVVDSLLVSLFPGPNAADQVEFRLVESWDATRLGLIDVEWNTPGYDPITSTGTLTWTLPLLDAPPFTATITKTFHVEPCTWLSTTVHEDVYELVPVLFDQQQIPPEQRPFVVNKTPPDLYIDSTYSSEVSPGQQASFTLDYGNNGGYENAVMIRNDFPTNAPFASAVPAPDRGAMDGSWVEWDVGDLANGDSGSIAVTVDIASGLSPSTTLVITDSIYNHVEEIADQTTISFHVLQPPLSLGDLVWHDANENGIQDAGEPGVQGIVVDLYARVCSGQAMASDTTDGSGNYLFEELSPGVYCLQFSNIPAGWQISPQDVGSNDAVDSDANPATAQITDINLTATDLDEDMGIYPPPGTFVLLVSRAGQGTGTVTSSPAGINCGSDCTETYEEGTVVSLSAVPDPGSTFGGWSGDEDCNDGTVTMDADRHCIATFNLLPPPFVPEASTLLLLGSGIAGLAGYAGLQIRSRRRK